jgi:hypothetical protein
MPITTIYDEKPTVDFKPIIETSIYRSYRAFKDLGVTDDEIPHSIMGPYMREVRFLTALGKDEKVNRNIVRIVRYKEANDPTEYVRYVENWTGKDWVGADIDPVTERVEGIIQLPNKKVKLDERGARVGFDIEGAKPKNEFTFSKALVDKWIEETGSDRNSIKYVVRTPQRRDDKATYEQFTSTTWVQAHDIMMQDGGFEMAYVETLRPSDKKKTS